MSVTVSQWRHRCVAAERQALKFERSAKIWKRRATVGRESAAAYLEIADAYRRVLVRLAAHHLGPDSSQNEALDLIHVWLDEDEKRLPGEMIAERKAALAASTAALEATMRRLGFTSDDEGGEE
jgi:hypothetical protein